MIGNIKPQSGFTLIEILVATGMFLIVFVIIADLAIIFMKNPDDIIRQKKLEREVDYMMEFMAQKIRNNNIDYNHYGTDLAINSNNPNNQLYLINREGQSTHFEFDNVNKKLSYFTISGDDDYLHADNIVVDNVDFYIYPYSDPFAVTNGVNVQPRVTISLQAHYVDKPDTAASVEYEDININLQTTIITRIYER